MNPIRAWNTFWFGPVSARPLGAFRIAFGVLFLASLALLTVDMDYWLTNQGLFRGDEAAVLAGPLRPTLLNRFQDPITLRVLFAALAVAGVLFTLGWRTRIMAVLLYLGTLTIHHRNLATISGADVLIMLLTFYLMLSPCGAAFSLDARRQARRRGTAAEPLILPWAQRLIQIQVCIVYFCTALMKSSGESWQGGTALHWVLGYREMGRFTFGLMQYPAIINLMTYGALFLEFALPFLLWSRGARRWLIPAGILLHTSIMLFINIPVFGELMICSYLVFLTPQELDAVLRRADPRSWFGRRAEPAPSAAVAPPWRLDAPADHARRPHLGAGIENGRPTVVSREG